MAEKFHSRPLIEHLWSQLPKKFQVAGTIPETGALDASAGDQRSDFRNVAAVIQKTSPEFSAVSSQRNSARG